MKYGLDIVAGWENAYDQMKAEKKPVKKYREDQERDDHGRFADEGGGGSSDTELVGGRTDLAMQSLQQKSRDVFGRQIFYGDLPVRIDVEQFNKMFSTVEALHTKFPETFKSLIAVRIAEPSNKNAYADYNSDFRSITIRPSLLSENDSERNNYLEDVRVGFHPPTNDVVKSILDHEFAHHIAFTSDGTSYEQARVEVRWASHGTRTGSFSLYAKANWNEAFAEAFSYIEGGKPPRDGKVLGGKLVERTEHAIKVYRDIVEGVKYDEPVIDLTKDRDWLPRILKYREDQERDENGRWVDEGGGATGGTTAGDSQTAGIGNGRVGADRSTWFSRDYAINPYTETPYSDMREFLDKNGFANGSPSVIVKRDALLTGQAAEKICSAYSELTAAIGIENIPKVNIHIVDRPNSEERLSPDCVAFSRVESMEMTLIMSHPDWQGAQGSINAHEAVRTGWLAQENMVVHEFGHFMDSTMRANSSVGRGARWGNPFDGSTKSVIAGKVSEYATTNNHEFVAETFAGIVGGKVYPDEVMSLYKMAGGKVF